jgi:NAD(P)-dependent dehydrogenase (short-subunit alcohol dehydrogenase family)
MEQAQERFGPIDILIANAGIADESQAYPIWDLPVDVWDKNYRTNVRGTFLTIKHFLRAAKSAQESQGGKELENLAIVITGSECTKFGEAGYSDYASGKAGLQYGLIQGLKNEIVRLNRKARVNAVALGPENVACAMAFLASHRVAGHISGQCISVEGGIDGRLIWKENEVVKMSDLLVSSSLQTIPRSVPKPPRNKIRVAVSIDLDAVSGWLGTGR